jgi:hypothetical protein
METRNSSRDNVLRICVRTTKDFTPQQHTWLTWKHSRNKCCTPQSTTQAAHKRKLKGYLERRAGAIKRLIQ